MNKKEIQTVNKLLSSIKLRVHHTTNVRCSAVSCYAPANPTDIDEVKTTLRSLSALVDMPHYMPGHVTVGYMWERLVTPGDFLARMPYLNISHDIGQLIITVFGVALTNDLRRTVIDDNFGHKTRFVLVPYTKSSKEISIDMLPNLLSYVRKHYLLQDIVTLYTLESYDNGCNWTITQAEEIPMRERHEDGC